MNPYNVLSKALVELVKVAREADDVFLSYLLMMALQEAQARQRKEKTPVS